MVSELNLPRKIVLIESDSALKRILYQNLELYTGSKVEFVKDADDLVDYLKREEEQPDLIISENMAGDEYTILKVFYYVNSQKLGIPVILLGENPKLKEQVVQIERSNWPAVIKAAAKLMSVDATSMYELTVPEFYPINIIILFGLATTPVDLFLKENSEYKSWLESGKELNQETIKEMLVNGAERVYLKRADRLSFAKLVSEHLQTLLQNEKDPAKLSTYAGESFNSIAAILTTTGFSEEMVRHSKVTIEAMEKIIKGSPKLDVLMSMLLKDESSVAWRHSLMNAVVASAMVEKIEWGNPDQINKLVFTSFFHDICIPDDRLATIHSVAELEEAKLKPDEKVKVEQHAIRACELLKSHPGVPFGVDSIILQHHGVQNGVGFPTDHLDNRISPLAIVFRVAEDYVHQLLSVEKPNAIAIIKSMENRYNKGQYQKAMVALKASHAKLNG